MRLLDYPNPVVGAHGVIKIDDFAPDDESSKGSSSSSEVSTLPIDVKSASKQLLKDVKSILKHVIENRES